jgi:predicted alpha/beta-hydrolase family hydrolase
MATSFILNEVDNAFAQVILAHGAGADMNHEFMIEMARLLNVEGINVLRFNFPFMDKRIETGKRYPPDRMPKLLECYQNIIDDFIQNNAATSLPLFIGGKSMGSRVASTLATYSENNSKISGVFCLGYPFHPTKKPEKLRLEPLFESQKPVLIVQGDRDTLGDKEEIGSYNLPEHCQSLFLADGDHSLKPRVKSGMTYQGHLLTASVAIAAFIKEHSGSERD